MHGSAIPPSTAAMGKRGAVLRLILVLHRWLGVVIGVLMTIWCLSGFVMLYVDYPRLLPTEQLRGLSPLQLPVAEDWDRIALAPQTALASARVEMMAGRPVLRVVPDSAGQRAIWQTRASPQNYELVTGKLVQPLSADDMRRVGGDFGRNFGIPGPVAAATPITVDQWTVQAFRDNSPLWRIDYTDSAGATAYIAGRNGEVVQETTRFERFWGWLGAIPHWLYPTMLRQHPHAWAQVVIWTSLAGCFLTVTGLWVGIARLRRGRDGKTGSPYRGLWWWHHISGLVVGLIALSWVASGLLSVSPWGVFDSDAGAAEQHRLTGTMHWTDVREALRNIRQLPPGTVRIESAPLGGRIYFVITDSHGHMARIDALGRPAILKHGAVEAALRNGPPLASLTLLRSEDPYYYAYKQPVKLPVWRAILSDSQRTRLYIDAQSGALIHVVDGVSRVERWLWNAPHSFDLPGLRAGLLRNLVILPLLAAVAFVCATGSWMGFRKLGRDLRRIRRRGPRHSPFPHQEHS